MSNRQKADSAPKGDGKERDSLLTRRQFESIVDVLRTRFKDYRESDPALERLSPTLDLATLRDVFRRACLAENFKAFCDELNALWAKRDARVKVVDEKKRFEFVSGQLFNNFVARVLEQRRKIGAAFLRRYVGEISPKLENDLDFAAYATEPTVHIFESQVSRLCDLVFSIPFKDKTEGSLAVVVPMEHKSTPTRNVVFQLLTSLVQVLQFVLQHKERFQRNDKRFVWPFLLLFYTGARPWRKILNLRDIFGTPEKELDEKQIFLLPFKVVNLFERTLGESKTEDDAWLNAFLTLTKEAERIVAKKDATKEDWENAYVEAMKPLKEFYVEPDDEKKAACHDFIVFANRVVAHKGWTPPTREEFIKITEKIGIPVMISEYKTVFDIERERAYEEGEQRASRNMLRKVLTNRFPSITQTALKRILSITDAAALESVFDVALSSNSLADFKKSVRALAPTI